MLKKVTGAAKDRLKQRLNPGQYPMPSKPRLYKHRGAMTVVSLSAVDNAAFESILDDDTDFISELSHNHSPSSALSSTGCNSSPMISLPTSTEPQESDIFNPDTFLYADEHKEETRNDAEEEDGVHGLVNCDPLSGQIVSQRVKEEDSRNVRDSKSEAGNCMSRNKEGDENEEGGSSCSGKDDDDNAVEIQNKKSIEPGKKLQNGARDDSDTNISLSGSSLDLFDNKPCTTKPILIPAGLEDQSSPLQNTDHQRGSSFHSESGLSGDASPSSFPSSFENEFNSFPSSLSDSATLRGEEHRTTLTTPLECSPPSHLPADLDHTPIPKHRRTAKPIPPTLFHAKHKPQSHDETPSTGLELELEELLASPMTSTSSFVLSKSPSEGSRKQRSQSSSEREGNGAHLDSGVFEHYGIERDSTPEQDRDKGRNARQEERSKEKALLMEEDRSATLGSCLETTALSRPEDTRCSRTTSVNKSDNPSTNSPTHPSTNILPLQSSVSSSVKRPGRSGSKGAPPPRPPQPLLGWKKVGVNHSATDQVRVKHVQLLARTKPCNKSEVVLDQKAELEDRVVADDLFSEDMKLEARTFSVFSDKVEEGREMASPGDEIELTHIKPARETTAQLMEPSPSDDDRHSTSTPITSAAALAVSDMDGSEPCLTLRDHCILSIILYLYYSFNIFPYLAGLFAGFFMLFLFLSSIFVCYMLTIDEKHKEKGQRQKNVEFSDDFVQTMEVDFSKMEVYQSNLFTATLSYDLSTHHPSQRMRTELKLCEDFKLFVQVIDKNYVSFLTNMVDIRTCKVSIEPSEVAQNRKRRWSKKFPIVINCPSGPRKFKVYLFSPTAREKEHCFRRLRSAASGLTSKQLISKQKDFFAYMQKYFSANMLHHILLRPTTGHREPPSSPRNDFSHGGSRITNKKKRANTLVQFSKSADTDEFSDSSEPSGGVNIKRAKGVSKPHPSSSNLVHLARHRLVPTPPPLATPTSSGSSSPSSSLSHQDFRPGMQKDLPTSTRVEKCELEMIDYAVDQQSGTMNRKPMSSLPRPMRSTPEDSANLWLNAMAARLCWDIWHEKRWKDWVMARIQKKLIRIKTPSFMEQLRLTDIDVGSDMPLLNRLVGGPRLDLKGIWIYLDITYQGKFVMTIETKMKLGGKGVASSTERGEEGQKMTFKTKDGSSLPVGSPLQVTSGVSKLSHTHAARALGGVDCSSVDPEDDIDSGSDGEEEKYLPHPLMGDALAATPDMAYNRTTPPPPSTFAPAPSGGFKSMVTRMAKKMASTTIVQRAAEKVSSYPLVLTVEVNRLDGVLAVNIPPPPTDTIWWGFHGSPKLELVAKPKLGVREVKLSKVTHWIEKKLCDIVNKKLVLPEMEDLVIPILNSGMPEDTQNPISSDSYSTNTTNCTSPS